MRLKNIPGSRERIAGSALVFDHEEVHTRRGAWHTVFGNDHPIYIEIGMGKGKFIVEMARRHPENNYIGIEKYSSVLVRALDKMESFTGSNLLFIRMDAEYICDAFDTDEIAGIYLNFSDPWPKDRHAKRRLTAVPYWQRYARFLKPNGTVTFKTDSEPLFDFSLEQVPLAGWTLLASSRDLHHSPYAADNVTTEYEDKFVSRGNPIYMLCAGRP